MKRSKRQVLFVIVDLAGLNHNSSLQKPAFKGPLHRRGRLWSQPNFSELSLKLSNYELRTLLMKQSVA